MISVLEFGRTTPIWPNPLKLNVSNIYKKPIDFNKKIYIYTGEQFGVLPGVMTNDPAPDSTEEEYKANGTSKNVMLKFISDMGYPKQRILFFDDTFDNIDKANKRGYKVLPHWKRQKPRMGTKQNFGLCSYIDHGDNCDSPYSFEENKREIVSHLNTVVPLDTDAWVKSFLWGIAL